MNIILKQKNRDIPNLKKIKALFKQGFTIRSLALNFHIPYATLYRALNQQSKSGFKINVRKNQRSKKTINKNG